MADQQEQQTNSGGGNSSGSGGGLQSIKQSISSRLHSNKHLVLKLHSVLTWEQDYYPIVIGVATTVVFLAIYLLDTSVLCTLSLFGGIATVIDYSLPMLTMNLLNTSKWTDKDTQRFDKICLDLAKYYQSMKFACDYMRDTKAKNPRVYYVVVSIFFLFMAWLGNQFNNLFLTYLLVLLVVFYPGLEKKNVPQKIFESIAAKLGRRPSTGGDRKSSSGRK